MQPKELSFQELKKGDVVLATNPCTRLCRVIDCAQAPVTRRGGKANAPITSSIPVVIVEACPCTLPIKGLVSERDARDGRAAAYGIYAALCEEGQDHRLWREIWAEREADILKMGVDGLMRETGEKRMQLYCVRIEDRDGKVLVSDLPGGKVDVKGSPLIRSGLRRATVEGVKVDRPPTAYTCAECTGKRIEHASKLLNDRRAAPQPPDPVIAARPGKCRHCGKPLAKTDAFGCPAIAAVPADAYADEEAAEEVTA